LILISAAAAAYYHYRRKPPKIESTEAAYVVPASVDVADSPAEVHSILTSLKSGERVGVVSRTARWVCIRLADGRTGWVEAKALLDAATQQKADGLLKGLVPLEPQATGHTTKATSLHLEPTRESIQLAEFPANLPVQVFARQIVARTPASQINRSSLSKPIQRNCSEYDDCGKSGFGRKARTIARNRLGTEIAIDG